MKTAWKKWKYFSKKFASFQADIVLSIIFFIFIIPISLVLKLKTSKKINSTWTKWAAQDNNLTASRRQY